MSRLIIAFILALILFQLRCLTDVQRDNNFLAQKMFDHQLKQEESPPSAAFSIPPMIPPDPRGFQMAPNGGLTF